MAKTILEMRNITKTFPGVKALDNVNLQVEEGEIHALVGENGAGKSTLMNVLSGIFFYFPDFSLFFRISRGICVRNVPFPVHQFA